MSRTDEPSSDPNPPTPPADDTREDVDEMDDRVFGGQDEQRRQENERPAPSGGVEDAGDGVAPTTSDGDPMDGEAPSG